MAELFRYAAFISYSSKDAAFARRLHRALESYGIPLSLGKVDLIGGGGKRNRIYPVFRDREELSAGHLGDQIEANLKASAALIVVCSPAGAASPWVQKEIEFFAALGRHAKIFAIIADNSPTFDAAGLDATQSCFPPVFRGDALAGDKLEPLAGDARKGKDGFRNAWLKVVAGIVGISPGQIIDRDKKRRARIRTAASAGILLLALTASLSAAVVLTSAARNSFTVRALSLIGERHPLDAADFAIAGLPAVGDIIGNANEGASSTLERTGISFKLVATFYRFQHTTGGELSSHGSLIYVSNAALEDGSYVYDLRRPNAPLRTMRSLGYVEFSPDNRFLAGTSGDYGNGAHQGFLFNLHGPRQDPIALGNLNNSWGMSFSPDGKFLITYQANGLAELRDLRERNPSPQPLGPSQVQFSEDGRFLLSTSSTGVGTLRDIRDSTRRDRVFYVGLEHELSPDGRYLFIIDRSGNGNLVDLLNPSAPQRMLGRIRPLSGDHPVKFSRNGRFLIAANWRTELQVLARETLQNVLLDAVLYDLSTPNAQPRHVAQGELLQELQAAFSSDNRFLLVQQSSGSELFSLDNMSAPPISVGIGPNLSFSPDGRFLLSGNALIDTHRLDRRERRVSTLSFFSSSFSPDGQFLVVQSGDRENNLVNLNDLSAPEIPLGPLGNFWFSGDGRYLLSDGDFTSVRDLAGLTARANRREICKASGEALWSFPTAVRTDRNGSLYQHLAGRPWHPCDWRGLLSIFPDRDHGAGWFEGLRQWIRLIGVRYFGTPDYRCGEINAGGSTSRNRIRACRLADFRASEEATHAND